MSPILVQLFLCQIALGRSKNNCPSHPLLSSNHQGGGHEGLTAAILNSKLSFASWVTKTGQKVRLFKITVHTFTNARRIIHVFTDWFGRRFKLLFSMCDDKDSRKRTTRASILAANRAASSSSESEEVGHAIIRRHIL